MNKRYGWTVWGIVGFVFIPVSLVLLGSGAIVFAAGRSEVSRIILSVFSLTGGVFLLMGIGFLSIDLRRRHRWRNAYNGGYEVKATVTGVQTVYNVNMNGSHPAVLECEHQGKIYRSRYLYRNIPEIGSEVSVYIDRMDDRIGYVDI